MTTKEFTVLILAASCCFPRKVIGAKIRDWLGPSQFYEGPLPSPRNSIGFASAGNRLFVWGGLDINGELILLQIVIKGSQSARRVELQVIEIFI